jgi:four helix bundle protein
MKDEPEDGPRDLTDRTFAFALDIIRIYLTTQKNPALWDLGRQFLKSGTSVGAHYREACRARSNAEFISKMEGGLQELDETDYWLKLLSAANLLTPQATAPLLREADELIRIFVTCVKNAKSR